MVVAYKEFAKVQSAFIDLESMPRTSDTLRNSVKPFLQQAIQLKADIRSLVDLGQTQLAPAQSIAQERELKAAKDRLKTRYPEIR
jgi:hypothetical protein